jgi:hypothetical protein
MTSERGKPRQPRDCGEHHSAPRSPAPRPPRGATGHTCYSPEEIEAQIAAEEENE